MNRLRGFLGVVTVATGLLAAALLFAYRVDGAAPVSAAGETLQSTISVSGSADVMVVPDQVVITLGIDTRNRDIVKAKEENDKIVKRILDLTKTFKIDAKDVQTDYMDIRPYDMNEKDIYYSSWYNVISPENVAYMARKKLVITLKDLTKFEDFITEVVKNGAEYVQGVEFKTTELRKHKDKARELAVKAAREKADAMTAALGQKAGKAVTIREEQEYYWSWYDGWYRGGSSFSASNVISNVQNSMPAGAASETGGIAPGQIKVQAKVSIDFILE